MQQGRTPVRIVAIAALISAAGTTAATIAIAVFIYAKTHSAVWLSVYLLFTFGVTGFISPFVGVLADRFNRRSLIIVTQLSSALVYVVMVFVDSPAAIVALGFIDALIAMPADSALRASVPNLAGRSNITWANGVLSMAVNIGYTVGPLAGGAISAAIGVDIVFWANAASFVVAAALVSTIRIDFSETVDQKEGYDILGGLRLIRSDRVLVGIAFGWMIGYFALDVVLVADLPFANALGVGAVGYSLMNTTWAAAAIGGSWIARWLPSRLYKAGLVAGGAAAFVGLSIGSIAPGLVVLLAALGVTAFFTGIAEVAGDSAIQVRTPDRLRGRVFAAVRGLGWISNAVAFSIAGFMVEQIGPRGVYRVGAVAGLAYGLILILCLRGSDVNMEGGTDYRQDSATRRAPEAPQDS